MRVQNSCDWVERINFTTTDDRVPIKGFSLVDNKPSRNEKAYRFGVKLVVWFVPTMHASTQTHTLLKLVLLRVRDTRHASFSQEIHSTTQKIYQIGLIH